MCRVIGRAVYCGCVSIAKKREKSVPLKTLIDEFCEGSSSMSLTINKRDLYYSPVLKKRKMKRHSFILQNLNFISSEHYSKKLSQ